MQSNITCGPVPLRVPSGPHTEQHAMRRPVCTYLTFGCSIGTLLIVMQDNFKIFISERICTHLVLSPLLSFPPHTAMSPALLPRDAISEGLPNPRGKTLANLSIAFACLSFFFVSSRLLVRYFINKLTGPDDYLILVSLVGIFVFDVLPS